MSDPEFYRFQHRRDTGAAWVSENPVLKDGEPALEKGTGRTKYGDGVTPWVSLPYSTVPPSVFIQTLMDDVDAAAARTTLGLAIGADVQAYDADLAAIAALATTTFGRALLTLADAAALRSAAALGTAATLTSDNDTALAANSATRVATQAAVKAYIDAAVTGLLDCKGDLNCSANPNYPAALKGDSYVVSVAGKIGGASGVSVDIGDVVVAKADNAGGTQAAVGASWFTMEHNLAGALLSANNLSDVASASAARTNLGIVIGADVQAYDADLAAIAALVSAANKLPYFTGSGAAALADLTAAGRALIAGANAAAQRATLELSTVPVLLPIATANTLAAGTPYYFGPLGPQTINTLAPWSISGRSGTITGFQVSTTAFPGVGQTYTYTLYKNGAATAITGTISGAASNTVSVSGGSVSVSGYDAFQLRFDGSTAGAGAAAAYHTGNVLLSLNV